MRQVLRADPIILANCIVRLRKEALNLVDQVLLRRLQSLARSALQILLRHPNIVVGRASRFRLLTRRELRRNHRSGRVRLRFGHFGFGRSRPRTRWLRFRGNVHRRRRRRAGLFWNGSWRRFCSVSGWLRRRQRLDNRRRSDRRRFGLDNIVPAAGCRNSSQPKQCRESELLRGQEIPVRAPAALLGRDKAGSSVCARGNSMRNVVPCPTTDSKSMSPSCNCTAR